MDFRNRQKTKLQIQLFQSLVPCRGLWALTWSESTLKYSHGTYSHLTLGRFKSKWNKHISYSILPAWLVSLLKCLHVMVGVLLIYLGCRKSLDCNCLTTIHLNLTCPWTMYHAVTNVDARRFGMFSWELGFFNFIIRSFVMFSCAGWITRIKKKKKAEQLCERCGLSIQYDTHIGLGYLWSVAWPALD